MVSIEVASQAGACYGVERALKMVKDAAEKGGEVQTLGPLIHNPIVVSDLERHGVTVADDVEAATASTVVIRSHGVVPTVVERARECGLKVIDATCPYVKKVQHAAERLGREGYRVIVVGESGHPEVEGILGHARGAVVVGSVADLARVELGRKVGVVVQTTQSRSLLREVVAELSCRVEDLRVLNTICEATSERQAAAAELAGRADAMVVIGGRNSANTTRLAEICAFACANTHHVERADELDPSWFTNVSLVGITAGASTPAAQIELVRKQIELLCGENL